MTATSHDQVDEIVGDARREALITAFADRLTLNHGMTPAAARRYATAAWAARDPAVLVAPGQIWLCTDPEPAESTLGALLHPANGRFVITEVDRRSGMVANDHGLQINYITWLPRHYRLAAWPAEHQPGVDHPQAPAAPIAVTDTDTDTEDTTDEEAAELDCRRLPLVVHRNQPFDPVDPMGDYLPLLGVGYHAQLVGPAHNIVFLYLDVLSCLRTHLADYRAGFDQWYATVWRPADHTTRYLSAFTEFGGAGELDPEVGAWMGEWLYQRVRADAVTEHGGRVSDYIVGFPWVPEMADQVVDALPGADPRVPLPVDHPLAQCPGQLELGLDASAAETR